MSLVLIESEELEQLIEKAVSNAMAQKPVDALMTVEQVSLRIHLKPKSVYTIKDKIGFIKQGKQLLFQHSDVEEYIKSCKINRKL